MSFPAATLILSDAVPREHQGIGASLVNTVINYSISLSLGFAGTVEVHLNDGGATEQGILDGYKAALYLGLSIASLGWVLSAVFVTLQFARSVT